MCEQRWVDQLVVGLSSFAPLIVSIIHVRFDLFHFLRNLPADVIELLNGSI